MVNNYRATSGPERKPLPQSDRHDRVTTRWMVVIVVYGVAWLLGGVGGSLLLWDWRPVVLGLLGALALVLLAALHLSLGQRDR